MTLLKERAGRRRYPAVLIRGTGVIQLSGLPACSAKLVGGLAERDNRYKIRIWIFFPLYVCILGSGADEMEEGC